MSETPSYNEKILLEQIASGNASAFGTLFQQYKDKVYALCMYMTRSELIAEEITQETFLKVWVKRTELTHVNYFNAYLRTIARNEVISYLRRMAKEQLVLTATQLQPSQLQENTVDHIVAYREYERLLKKFIDQLPRQQRIAYLLSREEGLSYEAIAAKMGLSIETVREYIKKALRAIRTFVENNIPLLLAAAILFN
ncbi:MAG: RNA polymerase sigma-70 factor [Filimonas sp.]|nr:RNA polymerase sigma-70 factor [Filimonas sp.]